MSTETKPAKPEGQKRTMNLQGSSGDTVYALGLFGAWAYYVGRAENWQGRILGFFKGLVWPAFLVYELLKFLNAK